MLWLNELTHERQIGADNPDPKAAYYRKVTGTPGMESRLPYDPRAGRHPSDTIHREWEGPLPVWTGLKECDSGWHRPHETGKRLPGAENSCPHCGMTAEDDLKRRRVAEAKGGPPVKHPDGYLWEKGKGS